MDDLAKYLHRHKQWSYQVFGPGLRTRGICAHIRKEVIEVEENPKDLKEWLDIVILAMDGFWRHGGVPELILPMLIAQQDRNIEREWPDWRKTDEDQPIEHKREAYE